MCLVKQSFQSRWIVILALLSLVILVVAACGSTESSQGSGLTPTPAQLQKCGEVSTSPRGSLLDPAVAQATADCLWRAYQQCQPAMMVFTATSLDTGVVRTFTIGKHGSSCVISDAVQHYIAPHPPKETNTYTCASMTKTSTELRFTACGQDGTVLVPTTVAP
jgi:hypothetical protein